MKECICKHSNCWYNCSICDKEIHQPDIEFFCDDSDTAWCSEKCMGIAEDRGMQQWESQQEDEG